MAEDSGAEKTQPASPMKIQKAREEGNVAKSQDLSAATSLLMALLALTFFGPGVLAELVAVMQRYMGEFSDIQLDASTLSAYSAEAVIRLGRTVVPIMLLLMVGGVAINLLQVGFIFSAKPITPKLSKLNPISGFKKFLSVRTLVELIKSILKLVLVGTIVYYTMRARWEEIFVLMHLTPMGIVSGVAGFVSAIWIRVVLAMFVLGLADYAFQYWQHRRDLRMTHQEVREETKQLEGDPKIKQRIRQIQRQIATQRMMQEVPEADVIITNPVRYAVALRYNMAEMQAPTVVAKGARILAQRIRDIGTEHKVPIVEKPELARALYRTIEIGEPIPENLFAAVAEILKFVYEIDRREEKVREREQSLRTQFAQA